MAQTRLGEGVEVHHAWLFTQRRYVREADVGFLDRDGRAFEHRRFERSIVEVVGVGSNQEKRRRACYLAATVSAHLERALEVKRRGAATAEHAAAGPSHYYA